MGSHVQRRYNEQEIEEGLTALAFHRSSRRAQQLTGIPWRTLEDWKTSHAERLAKVRAGLNERLAEHSESLALRYAEEQHAALDAFGEKKKELTARDAAQAAKNLAIAQGVQTDKALLLRGKPTARVHVEVSELFSKLQRLGMFVDGTATEVKDVEQLGAAD